MRHLLADLRIALRTLAKARGFSAAVIVTLALAVALAMSLAAVVNAYLIRSLPYPAAGRLYTVSYARPGENLPRGLAELPWSAVADVVEHPISWDLDMFYLVRGDHPEAARGAWVTRGFMDGLGIRPALGRAFGSEEFVSGGPQVALISDALWRRRFGGDSVIVGRRFEAYVSDRPDDPDIFTIIGVLPADFWHLNPYTEILTPLRAPSYPYLVRLREGVTAATAEQRLTSLIQEGAGLLPGQRVELRPVQQQYTRALRPILLAMAAAVGLVLLIAGANVVFLAVIRGLRRQREMAVRLALGAGRGRVARLLVAEALVLVGAAAVLGSVLAGLLIRMIAPAAQVHLGRPVPGGPAAVSLDGTVALATGILLLLMALALVLGPVLVTARQPLFGILRRESAGGSRGQRARASIIAVEVAGSLALLTACGLMLQTVVRLLKVDLGIEPAHVITATIGLRERSYPDAGRRGAFYERLQAALERTPGVMAAALSTPSPLTQFAAQPIRTEGSGASPAGGAEVRAVMPGYFTTVGLPLIQGRDLTPQDKGASEPVALVSETAARRWWPGKNPLGERLRVVENQITQEEEEIARTVIGVVKDAPQSPSDTVLAEVYIPLLQAPGRFTALVLRTTGVPRPWIADLRAVLRGLDPEIPLGPVRALSEVADEQLARPRFLAAVFAGFGGFATMLALIGIYGVISYAVKQREREIAIRLAVGADPQALRRLFLRQGGLVLLSGIAVGVPAALGIGRLLRAQLYGVAPIDLSTLVGAAISLGAAGMAAVWWPSRRASSADPMLVLREE